MILTIRDYEIKEQHHNASGRNERMEWNERRKKQDLGRAHLQQMLERSCWIINNERISLMWAYGRHLKIMR